MARVTLFATWCLLSIVPSVAGDTTGNIDDVWLADEHEHELEQHIQSRWRCRRYLQLGDMFSGKANMWRAFRRARYEATTSDVLDDPNQNMASKAGLYCAIELIMAVVTGGLLMWGPPCSMFIFLSSSIHKRSRRRPHGDEKRKSVRLANVIVRNMCFCIRLAIRRGVKNIIEQPTTSVMWQLPCLRIILKRWTRIHIAMYSYGHATYKPVVLWGDLPTLDTVHLPHSLNEFHKLKKVNKQITKKATITRSKLGATLVVRRKASSGVRGGPDLRLTAEYPLPFCAAVRRAWLLSRR